MHISEPMISVMENAVTHGDWGPWDFCPTGSYAAGMQLKVWIAQTAPDAWYYVTEHILNISRLTTVLVVMPNHIGFAQIHSQLTQSVSIKALWYSIGQDGISHSTDSHWGENPLF